MNNLLTVLTASGKKVQKFNLVYTALSNGSIVGELNQQVRKGQSGTEVTAVPDELYYFVGWSDDVLTASRTDTNVQGNISVEAIFALITPPEPISAETTAEWSVT